MRGGKNAGGGLDLKKYESKLNLMTGPGKKEYSDMAMKIISYIEDPVERKHYEQMVARKLDVTVEDLQAKKITAETVSTKTGGNERTGDDGFWTR